MTREEAIKELELIAKVTMWNDRREAVEMAIEALQKERLIEVIANNMSVEEITESEQYAKGHVDGYKEALKDRPHGEWKRNKAYRTIVFCSECGMAYKDIMQPRDYCPNCGADMRGDDE